VRGHNWPKAGGLGLNGYNCPLTPSLGMYMRSSDPALAIVTSVPVRSRWRRPRSRSPGRPLPHPEPRSARTLGDRGAHTSGPGEVSGLVVVVVMMMMMMMPTTSALPQSPNTHPRYSRIGRVPSFPCTSPPASAGSRAGRSRSPSSAPAAATPGTPGPAPTPPRKMGTRRRRTWGGAKERKGGTLQHAEDRNREPGLPSPLDQKSAESLV
jgi:hypothetical protein